MALGIGDPPDARVEEREAPVGPWSLGAAVRWE